MSNPKMPKSSALHAEVQPEDPSEGGREAVDRKLRPQDEIEQAKMACPSSDRNVGTRTKAVIDKAKGLA
jgi:hypothetical protein